jgi:hypothetical protein
LALVEICGERLYLGSSFVECTGAIDFVSGVFEFFFDGKLGGEAAASFGFAHAPGAQAFELLFRCAPGDDEAVESFGHASFDEQRGFDKRGGVSAAFFPVPELIENDLIHARVKDGIEFREFRSIGEDDGREFVAVYLAGSIGKTWAERIENFVVSGLAGFHQFVGDGIGVENWEAKFAENGGNRAFAAGNAAGEAEFPH